VSLDITISPGSSTPIFRQIIDQVRLSAARGSAQTGTQLPSVRALAERLVLNPNTVARAYAELAREGLIETQPGKGVFLARPRQMYTRPERLRRLEPALDALVNEAIALNFVPTELVEALQKKLSKLNLSDPPKGGRHE
jgi:GntR family transcriptional regulator